MCATHFGWASQLEGPNAIQTSKDVYVQLALEGYNIDYLRVPMTDEKAPKVGSMYNAWVIHRAKYGILG